MKKYLIISAVVGIAMVGVAVYYFNLPKVGDGELLGTSITTIQGTDTLSNSRTTINNNFAALNTGKLEASSYFSTTTHATITTLPALTTASALTTIGTLGSLTLSSALTVANGGTGRTSLTSGQLIYGSGANAPISVATTTPTFGLGFTGGGTWTVLGSAPTLTLATSSLYTGTTGQIPYFSGTNTITATSSLFLATSGKIGVSSSTPMSTLSIGTASATSTISTGKFCMFVVDQLNRSYWITLNLEAATAADGIFATSTVPCF